MNDVLTKLRTSDKSPEYAKKTLSQRLSGRFYTPSHIGSPLAKAVSKNVSWKKCAAIIDPFCGDGRLICAFLEENACRLAKLEKLDIHVWDCDEKAVADAQKNISRLIQTNKLRADITAEVGDAFRIGLNFKEKFDVCVTNPPWEALKPDRRELAHLSSAEKARLISALRREDEFYATEFPQSQPERKFSGWGTNISRVGTELSISLLKSDGALGIIVPASLFCDQNSLSLRKWIFENASLREVNYFPAELKSFPDVDQSFVSVSATKSKREVQFDLRLFDRHGDCETGKISNSSIQNRRLVNIPFQIGFSGMEIESMLDGLPTLGSLENNDQELGIWMGREIDETGIASKLGDAGVHPFIKGRMVDRYKFPESPQAFLRELVVPKSSQFPRIVWRDVSRPSQIRRMQATIIPPGWVTGNSLHVLHLRQHSKKSLLGLLTLLNSSVMEVQIRGLLTTSHVSLGVVRNTRIPQLQIKDIERLASFATGVFEQRQHAETRADIAVAKLFKLSEDAFISFMQVLTRASCNELDTNLIRKLWNEQ
ncbi:Eco57I restriction-modification methylase domain-containing protein [Ruegeria sp. Alg231-54]|uniref:Eco57I restriction-modification methylase domain-containing protein n=1 Tax=Ruegeria sp. Alg231-54 TaxID=1922221 RepID=UPI000D54B5B2|nr:N-6 DNA methylase [Ruegeria sp. Alg231-54]